MRYPLLFFTFFFSHFYFPASGQAVVTGVVPSPSRFLPSIFIAHRVQRSHCSSIFHRVLLTHALALSASQFMRKKKSLRIYVSIHSAGLELTKLTYTRLEDNLVRHRGDRLESWLGFTAVPQFNAVRIATWSRLVTTLARRRIYHRFYPPAKFVRYLTLSESSAPASVGLRKQLS